MKFAGTYFSRRIQIPLSVPCSRSHLGRAPTTGGNEHTKRPLAGSCQRWSKCPPRSRVRLTDAPYGETTPRRVHVETHLSKGKKNVRRVRLRQGPLRPPASITVRSYATEPHPNHRWLPPRTPRGVPPLASCFDIPARATRCVERRFCIPNLRREKRKKKKEGKNRLRQE